MDAATIQSISNARHRAFMAEMSASMPTFSIPYGDSDYTAPGWLFWDGFIYTYPDVMYPWDPAVIKAIREFCPDVIPITARTTYRYSNYNEQGRLGDPVTFIRHGLARIVRDPKVQPHPAVCRLPIHTTAFDRGDPHVLSAVEPNWVEVYWQDNEVKEHGQDLPGAYLPSDWELYYAVRRSYRDQESGRDQANRIIGPHKARYERQQQRRSRHPSHCQCDDCYVHRDILARRDSVVSRMSDAEIEAEYLGAYEAPAPAPTISVPDTAGVFGGENA
jgi:hypothetical protein